MNRMVFGVIGEDGNYIKPVSEVHFDYYVEKRDIVREDNKCRVARVIIEDGTVLVDNTKRINDKNKKDNNYKNKNKIYNQTRTRFNDTIPEALAKIEKPQNNKHLENVKPKINIIPDGEVKSDETIVTISKNEEDKKPIINAIPDDEVQGEEAAFSISNNDGEAIVEIKDEDGEITLGIGITDDMVKEDINTEKDKEIEEHKQLEFNEVSACRSKKRNRNRSNYLSLDEIRKANEAVNKELPKEVMDIIDSATINEVDNVIKQQQESIPGVKDLSQHDIDMMSSYDKYLDYEDLATREKIVKNNKRGN